MIQATNELTYMLMGNGSLDDVAAEYTSAIPSIKEVSTESY